MDLTKINEAASKAKPTSIKTLDTTRQYLVTELREVTTGFGKKIVASLEDDIFIYLPTNLSNYLRNNSTELHSLQDAANKYKLVIRPLGGFVIKFEIV